MLSLKRSTFFLLILALALVATGCGPSMEETYLTNLTSRMNEYASAMEDVTAQLSAFTTDSLDDAGWMDTTFAALDRLDAAGQMLASIPVEQVPEEYVDFDNILVQISEQTTVFVEDFKAALESQDNDAILAAVDEFQKVLDLFAQGTAELNAIQ